MRCPAFGLALSLHGPRRPTRETLAAMEKLLRSEGEAAKVAIRHARKRALDAVKELDSEDDRKQLERKVPGSTARQRELIMRGRRV